MHEITIFPGGKHDDQVDSTAQALNWIKMDASPSRVCSFTTSACFEIRRSAVLAKKAQPLKPLYFH